MAKTTIEKVRLNNWSRSYNINVLSIPLAAAQMLAANEHLHFFREDNEWSAKTVTLLAASCVMGLGMSVATMWIREAISATSVSVVATCNKFISELVNWVIWNKHTTSDGGAKAWVATNSKETARAENDLAIVFVVLLWSL